MAYHKVWLGAAESNRFTAGDERTVLQVNGRRLGLAICKDTSIPQQHASDTAALGIDAHVAGTGVRGRRRHPGRACPTRRPDHDVWVAVASFAGAIGGGFAWAAAHSAIWAPNGVVTAQAGPEPGAIARATLS